MTKILSQISFIWQFLFTKVLEILENLTKKHNFYFLDKEHITFSCVEFVSHRLTLI